MLRYEDIDDISDGKRYKDTDKACIGTHGCQGCSKCCESDMGTTIVLTPFDVYELTRGTGKSFDDMLVDFSVQISMIDGIALPHLKMDDGCKFLKDSRCSVHQFRPGICRLFPLGRIYEAKDFSYFIQVHECPVPDKEEVLVREWLGIEDLEENSSFINKWHRFIHFEQKKINEIREWTDNEANRIKGLNDEELIVYAGIVGDELAPEQDEDIAEEVEKAWNPDVISGYREKKIQELTESCNETIKGIMKTVLGYFFLDNYDAESSFYSQFDDRMKKCLAALRKF